MLEKAFDVQSIERKVVADFQVAVHGQLGEINSEMKAFTNSYRGVSNKVQKKLIKLEKRQVKVFKLLQNINDRMEEEETRNTKHDPSMEPFRMDNHKIQAIVCSKPSQLEHQVSRSLAITVGAIGLGCHEFEPQFLQ